LLQSFVPIFFSFICEKHRHKLVENSPDLNIIEAVWDHQQTTSKEELWDDLQEAWRTIPEDYLKK